MSTQVVRDIMKTELHKVDGLMCVADALEKMKKEDVHVVLVDRRNENDVYGILTLRDIARRAVAKKQKLKDTHVYEIMSKPVLSVNAHTPITYAARLLTNFNVAWATVEDNNEVVGMISLNGIVLYGTDI